MEPPKTWVLDIKDVVRNQIYVLEQQNGVKIPKILVLDLKEWIEIFHVVCLESFYSETFNQMHPDTSIRYFRSKTHALGGFAPFRQRTRPISELVSGCIWLNVSEY